VRFREAGTKRSRDCRGDGRWGEGRGTPIEAAFSPSVLPTTKKAYRSPEGSPDTTKESTQSIEENTPERATAELRLGVSVKTEKGLKVMGGIGTRSGGGGGHSIGGHSHTGSGSSRLRSGRPLYSATIAP